MQEVEKDANLGVLDEDIRHETSWQEIQWKRNLFWDVNDVINEFLYVKKIVAC